MKSKGKTKMKTLVKMMAAVVLPALAAGAAELEGWWRFTEADGDEAADASGKGRAALLDTNRVWRVTDAPGGGALWFDGVTNVTAAADDYCIAPLGLRINIKLLRI
jgi:hypothetical protein